MGKVLFTLKILTCGVVFFVGTILGGMVAAWVGLPTPAMPDGTDPTTLAGYLLLASLGIGALLAFLARRLSGSTPARWLALSAFGWVVYSLSTYIEAAIYTTFESASLYKVVMDLVAFGMSSAAAARLFQATTGGLAWRGWARFSTGGWAWRLAAAWVAFPVIYLSFGKLVEPFVIDMYRQSTIGLVAPGWAQIIPAQMLRSLLFLAVSLGLAARWNRARLDYGASLAAAMFLLVGGFYMLQAYWFPVGLRLIHSLEMLADSLVYALCLAALFYFKPGMEAISEPGTPSAAR